MAKKTAKKHSKLLRQEAEDFIKATDKAESKKVVKNATKKEDELSNWDLEKRIIALEQRIDRIVSAIDKSKKVRGL